MDGMGWNLIHILGPAWKKQWISVKVNKNGFPSQKLEYVHDLATVNQGFKQPSKKTYCSNDDLI